MGNFRYRDYNLEVKLCNWCIELAYKNKAKVSWKKIAE